VPLEWPYLVEMHAIEQESFSDPWSLGQFIAELGKAEADWLIALDDGVVVGYAGLQMMVDEAHITNLAVAPAVRGRGVGAALLARALEGASARGARLVTLEVRESNTEAEHLYRRYGFKAVGRRPRYYADTGEDALIMSLELEGGMDGAAADQPEAAP
jgi:ribosomal-protein-alanine N-acetyltransferase